MPQYHILADAWCVQAWTDTKPYCGAGRESTLRRREPYHQALCAAIRDLESSVRSSGALRAIWTTVERRKNDPDPPERLPDTENLLIWEVGSALKALSVTDLLRFERQIGAVPPPPHVLGFEARHHLRYEAVRQPLAPTNNTVLAQCDPVVCELNDLKKVWRVWRLLKQNVVRTPNAGNWRPGDQFNVQIELSGPKKVNLADWEMVKAVVDGFIASLHYYAGDQLDQVSDRIQNRLGGQASQWRDLLLLQTNAVLGAWRVPHLKPKGKHLAWSPCDHLLMRCEFIQKRSTDGGWSIAGRLIRQRSAAT